MPVRRYRTTATTTVAAAALAAVATVLAPLPAAGAAASPRLGECAPGQLCLWPREDFRGARQTHELSDTDVESCVPLPAGTPALSLANRTGRPVATFQDRECAETGEFDTHPSGSWTPESPYLVRAVKIWER